MSSFELVLFVGLSIFFTAIALVYFFYVASHRKKNDPESKEKNLETPKDPKLKDFVSELPALEKVKIEAESNKISAETLNKEAADSESKVTLDKKHIGTDKPVVLPRSGFWKKISSQIFNSSKQSMTFSETYEGLEEALFTSDLGPKTINWLLEKADSKFAGQTVSPEDFEHFFKSCLQECFDSEVHVYDSVFSELIKNKKTQDLQVLLVVGVNGAGKTTSIGKMAHNLSMEGKKVLLAAGDTFRAAASEQLSLWQKRAQVDIFSPQHTKDPAAVAYEAVQKSLKEGYEVCLVDTAGRLHTQDHLMSELIKVKRVLSKIDPEFPQNTWIVLDANSGQNALQQARKFNEGLGVDGVILSKMDGTTKGGVAFSVHHELSIPLKYLGLGEKATDFQSFEPKKYIDSLF